MASLYKKVISGRPYWYLREMGWVDGKPKMVSERYVGTAAEVEALLDAREERMLPERSRHHRRGDRHRAAWAAAVAGHLRGAGGAEPGGRSLLQEGVRGLVADHGGGPVHQDPGLGAGSPPVLGRVPRGAAGGAAADRGEAGAGGVRPVRAGHQLGGAGHDEFRDLHRYRQRQAPIAQRGKAKQKRS